MHFWTGFCRSFVHSSPARREKSIVQNYWITMAWNTENLIEFTELEVYSFSVELPGACIPPNGSVREWHNAKIGVKSGFETKWRGNFKLWQPSSIIINSLSVVMVELWSKHAEGNFEVWAGYDGGVVWLLRHQSLEQLLWQSGSHHCRPFLERIYLNILLPELQLCPTWTFSISPLVVETSAA